MSSSNDLARQFPGLRSTDYEVQSAFDPNYNCIAWAARDTREWWEPDPMETCYWPPDVPREYSIGAYKAAFEALGYSECADQDLEPGFEKVAIFAREGMPAHAARQKASGRWTSKLGRNVDIEHELEGLVGDFYGRVALVLKKSV